MSKYPRVKGTVTKTNVLKKNKNYHAIMELMEFLKGYGDIGYTIKIIEQNPVVDENFQKDIFHNVLFNYLVLKGHLERDKDRRLPAPMKEKKRSLKPKFIKEIIEELTEDYDLPDIEIRKVLIEELTKEQLMREEAAERRRLVEEQEKRKKEEDARLLTRHKNGLVYFGSYPQTKERLGADTPPARYFLDETPSADTNEIAIYWNSPAVFTGAYFNLPVRS